MAENDVRQTPIGLLSTPVHDTDMSKFDHFWPEFGQNLAGADPYDLSANLIIVLAPITINNDDSGTTAVRTGAYSLSPYVETPRYHKPESARRR